MGDPKNILLRAIIAMDRLVFPLTLNPEKVIRSQGLSIDKDQRLSTALSYIRLSGYTASCQSVYSLSHSS